MSQQQDSAFQSPMLGLFVGWVRSHVFCQMQCLKSLTPFIIYKLLHVKCSRREGGICRSDNLAVLTILCLAQCDTNRPF